MRSAMIWNADCCKRACEASAMYCKPTSTFMEFRLLPNQLSLHAGYGVNACTHVLYQAAQDGARLTMLRGLTRARMNSVSGSERKECTAKPVCARQPAPGENPSGESW